MFHKQSIMKYIVSEEKMRETRTLSHNKKTIFLEDFRQSVEKTKQNTFDKKRQTKKLYQTVISVS